MAPEPVAKASGNGGVAIQAVFGDAAGEDDGDPEKLKLKSLIPHSLDGPQPFFLCRVLQPDFADFPSGPPVVETAVAATIAEGFQKYARANKPFIVHGVSAFDFAYEPFRARMQAEGLTTFAWDKKLVEVKDIPVASALADWEAGALKVNFVDSPIPKMVPNAGIHEDLRAIGVTEDQLMLVLSNKGAYTQFHQDPIGGTNSGGGWMWLLRGKKVWQFVAFEHTDCVYEHPLDMVSDPKLGDLVRGHNGALWGKVSETFASAGDFLYFPPACNHRVWTYEDSIGVGGYTQFDFDAENVAAAVKWYEGKGVKPEHGIWPDHERAEAYAAAKRPRLASPLAASA